MAFRNEVEDGFGCSGLVPTKAEKREEARMDALEKDAKRYRYLRRNPTWLGWDDGFMPDEIDREVDIAIASER
jgi:hypothetical protein